MSGPIVPPVGLRDRLARWAASPTPWVFFLVLGMAIRLRDYLFAASYWYDESYLLLVIREHGFAALLGPQPYNLVIPPFFLWAVRGLYQLGGDGELLMRLPAFVAGLAALFLMIPLARRLVPRPWSVWAFALLAVSPHAVSHGCEVRPYTVDLLVGEWVLLCTAALLDAAAPLGRGLQTTPQRRWAAVGLGAAALLGPWLSFPSAFFLGGASAALLLRVWRRPSIRAWAGWAALNAAAGASAALLWWVSARAMYYPGMAEHWGPHGWNGFPDWHSPLALARWLLSRPYEAASYGNRDLGVPTAALAAVGGIVLAWRARDRAVLLAAPFGLAVAAALLGKYPFAHRTTMFVLPCLWLFAAFGLEWLARRAGRRGWTVAIVGVLLAAYAAWWTAPELLRPDAGLDYRGAYRFVQAHRLPGEPVFAQMAVVYQTYYGVDAPVLKDEDFPAAARRAGEGRLWAVVASDRLDLRRGLESDGGRVVLERRFSRMVVLLLEPRGAE